MPSEEALKAATLERKKKEVAAIIRWLLLHPVEMDLLSYLVVNEGPMPEIDSIDLDRARTYFEHTRVGFCPYCWEALAVFPDARALRWPSLTPHKCDPIKEDPRTVNQQYKQQRPRPARPGQDQNKPRPVNPNPLDI